MNDTNQKYSIIIIGGGIIGCAIGYELSMSGYKNIAVIEKNSTIPGLNQSSTNGGIIHSGLYYPKDIEPLKTRLCVEGNKLMYQFCKKYNIPHKKTGKLIIATNPQEAEYLNYFFKIGRENGVKVKKISKKSIHKMEPNIGNTTMALFVPSTGSVALNPLVSKLKSLAEKRGVQFLLGTKITAIGAGKTKFTLTVKNHKTIKHIQSNMVINAAGLYSDEVAKMINPMLRYHIDPARGEFFKYNPAARKTISPNGMHLYPTPFFYYNDTKKIVNLPIAKLRKLLKKGKITKTLGAHISPIYEKTKGKYSFNNIVTVGPLKTLNVSKEDYKTNLKTGQDYVRAVGRLLPKLRVDHLKFHKTGIMAVLYGHSDFIIKKDDTYPKCIQLIGMDSPAFTASLAIAKYVRKIME